MPLFLRGRIVTWCSVLLLFPCAGLATFYFAWSQSRKWNSPDRVTSIFRIAAMILNAIFGIKCLFMVHSLRLKSKTLGFALFCALGVAATIADCCWLAFMAKNKGFDKLCEGDEKACKRKVISITYSAFLVIYAILTFLVMLVCFYFDAHWNYSAPAPAAVPAAPPQPYMQMPTTAQSLRKYLPSSSRLQAWSPFGASRGAGQAGKGHHVPLINITHDFEDGDKGENSVLFDSAGVVGHEYDDVSKSRNRPRGKSGNDHDDFAASSDETESDEEAQLEYEKRRRERKGKYRAEEDV